MLKSNKKKPTTKKQTTNKKQLIKNNKGGGRNANLFSTCSGSSCESAEDVHESQLPTSVSSRRVAPLPQNAHEPVERVEEEAVEEERPSLILKPSGHHRKAIEPINEEPYKITPVKSFNDDIGNIYVDNSSYLIGRQRAKPLLAPLTTSSEANPYISLDRSPFSRPALVSNTEKNDIITKIFEKYSVFGLSIIQPFLNNLTIQQLNDILDGKIPPDGMQIQDFKLAIDKPEIFYDNEDITDENSDLTDAEKLLIQNMLRHVIFTLIDPSNTPLLIQTENFPVGLQTLTKLRQIAKALDTVLKITNKSELVEQLKHHIQDNYLNLGFIIKNIDLLPDNDVKKLIDILLGFDVIDDGNIEKIDVKQLKTANLSDNFITEKQKELFIKVLKKIINIQNPKLKLRHDDITLENLRGFYLLKNKSNARGGYKNKNTKRKTTKKTTTPKKIVKKLRNYKAS